MQGMLIDQHHEVLGKGGQGTVYRGTLAVALKTVGAPLFATYLGGHKLQ